MATSKRVLMILEDDRDINDSYAMYCRMALKQLAGEGLPLEVDQATVQQAYNYTQAKAMLEDGVDFCSVDLALSESEYGLTEDAREQRDVGGMVLLEELRQARGQPLSIVVSGETLQSYVIDALGERGVLAFYQKSRLNPAQYMGAIKAALWYKYAAELVSGIEAGKLGFDHISLAEQGWEKALQAAGEAGIRPSNLPVDLGLQLGSLRIQVTHPSTKLPLGRWTADELLRALRSRDWAIVQVRIEGFNEFISENASQEEAILVFAAQRLQSACQALLEAGGFTGHFERRGQHVDPSFVVITSVQNAEAAQCAVETAADQFNSRAHLFVDRGFGDQPGISPVEAKVRPGMVSASQPQWMDFHELLDRLGSPI
jgi:hypothetical protein